MLKRLLYVSVITLFLGGCQNERNNIEETNYKKMNNTEPNGGYMRLATESPILDEQPTSEALPLYMTDFKERWNAISDEQTGELFIEKFQPMTNPLQFSTTLKSNLELEIHTVDENQISEIKIIATGQTNADFLRMLTSWWQVLLITNPRTELHEVDALFSKLGLGPNSSLEDLEDLSFSYGGLKYIVNSQESKITFEARYPTATQGGE